MNNMSEKSKRISFPKEVREYVFQRDNHQCQSCGKTAKLSIDHIIPLATGRAVSFSASKKPLKPTLEPSLTFRDGLKIK